MMNNREIYTEGLQLLIDFSNGERWHLPADLLDDYERFFYSLTDEKRLDILQSLSSIYQYWLARLPRKYRERISLVKSEIVKGTNEERN